MKRTSLSLLWLFMSWSTIYAQYCIPSYSTGPSLGLYIDGVALEGIQNLNSGENGTEAYKDYSSDFRTSLTIGRTYDLSVTVGPDYFGSVGVWIDFNQDNDFEDEGEFVSENRDVQGGNSVSIPITIPNNSLSGATRMRIIQVYSNPALTPCGSYGFGETEDYGLDLINPSTDDIGISAIISPRTGCGLDAQELLKVEVSNFGTDPQQNVTLGYSLDGLNPVTEEASLDLSVGAKVTYQFASSLDLSALSIYELKVWTVLPNDTTSINDTLTYTLENKLLVENFPYREDFEQGPGGWEVHGTNASWELGAPEMTVINTAASGTQAWSTGGVSGTGYRSDETSFLTSPCLDFSNLGLPIFEVNIWWESQLNRDGTQLQVSIDGGETWQVVGNINEGENWYNRNNISSFPIGERQGWSGNSSYGSGGWLPAKYFLTNLAGEPNVKLRFKFAANSFGEFDGFAVDDIQIYDFPANDVGITRFVNPRFPFRPGHKDIAVEFTNFGLDTLRSLNIHFEVNGVEQEMYRWTGELAKDEKTIRGIAEFTFDRLTQYDLRIWTSMPNGVPDENQLNDSLVLDSFMPAFGGDVLVGSVSADFSDLTETMFWLHDAGIFDSVSILINPGIYQGQIDLRYLKNLSGPHPVHFQSANSDSSEVIIRYEAQDEEDNFVVRIDSLSNVSFDYLTLRAEGSDFARVIEFRNGTSQNRFSHNLMVSSFQEDSSLQRAIVSGSSIQELFLRENQFLSNTFLGGSYGIWHKGLNYNDAPDQWEIRNNRFIDQSKGGVYLERTLALSMDNNHIQTSLGIENYTGAYLLSCNDGSTFTRNHILLPEGGNGLYISNTDFSGTRNSIVANNYISIGGVDKNFGIYLGSFSRNYIYYNTIHIYNKNIQSTALNGDLSANNEIINNSFSNIGSGRALYLRGISSNGNFQLDHNNYFTNGSILITKKITSRPEFANYARLNDFQRAENISENSISVYPFFYSDSSVKAREIVLDRAGTPISQITTDIFGNPRNSQHPDIGAYEFAPSVYPDAGLVEIREPIAPFLTGEGSEINVKLRNYGIPTLNGASIEWFVNGISQGDVSWTGNLATKEETSVSLGYIVFNEQTKYEIEAVIQTVNALEDTAGFNNYIRTDLIHPALAGNYTIGGEDGDFDSFGEAVEALKQGGVVDTVRFWIRDGVYEEQIALKDILYRSEVKPIYFSSESLDSSLVTLTYRNENPANNYTLLLDNVRDIHFSHISFQATGQEYARVIAIKGSSFNTSFENSNFRGVLSENNDELYRRALVRITTASLDVSQHHTFENNTFSLGSIGIEGISNLSRPLRHVQIKGNSYEGQSQGGIRLGFMSQSIIKSNQIIRLRAQDIPYVGIYLGGSMYSNEVRDNFIEALGNSIGISIDRLGSHDNSSDFRVYNNLIQLSSGTEIIGIKLDEALGEIFHNTVQINSPRNTGSAALFYAERGNANDSYPPRIANNIFSNSSDGYALWVERDLNASTSIDYNNYYSTGYHVINVKNNDIDLASWQDTYNQDLHSYISDPKFISTTNLRTTSFLLRNVGLTTVNIPTDIEGNEREGLPDLGAYEQIGDFDNSLAIVGLASPSISKGIGNRDVNIVIQNQGTNPVQNANISWTLNGLDQTGFDWTGNLEPSEKDTITLGNFDFAISPVYQFVFWISPPQDNQNLNDTLEISLDFNQAPLNGIYSIGTNDADFETFQAAVSALTEKGINGSVRFEVQDGLYTEQIRIPQIEGATQEDTILFISASNDSSSVELTYSPDQDSSNYVLWLDGAKHIHFSQLSITNESQTHGRVVWIGNGVSNTSFDYIHIEGTPLTSRNENHSLMYVFSSAVTEVIHDIHITNSTFLYGNAGILADGPFNTGITDTHNWKIKNNKILFPYQYGIKLFAQNNLHIQGNYIEEDSLTRNSGFDDFVGLSLARCNKEVKVIENQIIATNGGYGIGVEFYTNGPGLLIANNFVSLGRVGMPNSGNAIVRGIYVNRGENYQIYHNSVSILRNDFSGNNSCIYFERSGKVDLKNNIFANFGGGKAIFAQSLNSTLFSSDFNNFYSTGVNLGYWNRNTSNLLNWQFSSQGDYSSVSVDPEFPSRKDLHINLLALNGIGTQIPEISRDIDDDIRTVKPDLGADEFIGDDIDRAIVKILNPTEGFVNGEQDVQIVIHNNGIQTIDTLAILWWINGEAMPTYEWQGQWESGISDTITLGSYLFESLVPHTIECRLHWIRGDQNLMNDVLKVDSLYSRMGGVYTISQEDSSADFSSFTEAIAALQTYGVGDSVIIKILPGEYEEHVVIGEIPYVSVERPIIFESLNLDSTSVILRAPTSNSPTLRIRDAQYLSFQHLSITYPHTRRRDVISIENNSAYISLKHNVIKGENTNADALIKITDSSQNILCVNNTFSNALRGIYATPTANYLQGLRIEKNIFLSMQYGIVIRKHEAPAIISNYFKPAESENRFIGIQVQDSKGKIEIAYNEIEAKQFNRGIDLDHCYASQQKPIRIYNNIFNGIDFGDEHFGEIGGRRGISLKNSSHGLIAYNTIRTNSGERTSPSTAIHFESCLAFSISNNIIATYGDGYAIYTDKTEAILQSDHNYLFSSGENLAFNQTSKKTLEDWQIASGQDEKSQSFPLVFRDSALVPNSSILAKAARPISDVVNDFRRETRDTQHPSIGAYEYESPSVDAGLIEWVTPEIPVGEGQQMFEVSLQNYGIDTLISTEIHWEVNGIAQPVVSWTGILLSGDSEVVTLGSTTLNPTDSYKVNAWTSLPNNSPDSINYNDTLSIATFFSALAGVYTIGGNDPDFPTLNEAVDALKIRGVSDSVIFRIRDGVYEDQVILPEIDGTSQNNYIVFESESKDSSLVEIKADLTGNTGVIVLDGITHIYLRHLGIGSVGTTTRSLIHIINGSNHIHIISCLLNGKPGIGTAINAVVPKRSIKFELRNSRIISGELGISWRGLTPSNETLTQDVFLIEQNIFKNQTEGGINLTNLNIVHILDNHISNKDTSAFGSNFIGIIMSNIVQGFEIQKNKINILNKKNNFSSTGISMSNSGANSSGIIANNMVAIDGKDESTRNIRRLIGINISSPSIRVVYNSVLINPANYPEEEAYTFQVGGQSNVYVLNNNFVSLGDYPAFHYIGGLSTPRATGGLINHNNIFNQGEKLFRVSQSSGKDYSLNDWQFLSGMDQKSISVNPEFFGVFDLHTLDSQLDSAGVSVSWISEDIDGVPRDANYPDIGADEFGSIPLDAGLVGWKSPSIPIVEGQNPITVRLSSFGNDTLRSATINWAFNDELQTAYEWSGNLTYLDTTDITIGNYELTPGRYDTLSAWVEAPNGGSDLNPVNDSLKLYLPLAGRYTIGGSNPDFPNFTRAIETLERHGIADSVIFEVRNGGYFEKLKIQEIPGASAENYVVFEGATTFPPFYTIEADPGSGGSLLELENASHIRFRNLTFFVNTTQSQHTSAIFVNRNSDFISIEGCNIIAAKDVFEGYGIRHINNGETQSFRLINSSIFYGYHGLHWVANSNAQNGKIHIQGNTFKFQETRGIHISYMPSVEIRENFIEAIASRPFKSLYFGISVSGITDELMITQNEVWAKHAYAGIDLSQIKPAENKSAKIVNNMVTVQGGPVNTARIGLSLNGEKFDILHNSILITARDATQSNSWLVYADNAYGIRMLNNNFINKGQGVSLYGHNFDETINESDYNNWYTTGSALIGGGGTAVPRNNDLEVWRDLFNFDQNSISVLPDFFYDFNLHTEDTRLDGKAIPLAEVPFDFDGDPRDPINPDIGADEFDEAMRDLSLDFVLIDSVNCGLGENEIIQVQISNPGNRTINEPVLAYIINGGNPVYDAPDGVRIDPGETDIFTFSRPANLSNFREYELLVYIEYLGFEQTNYENDTLRLTFVNSPEINGIFTDLQPADRTNDQSVPLNFSWSPIDGALSYDLRIWPEQDSTDVIEVSSLDNTEYTYSAFLNGSTRYNWKVIAKGGCNNIESAVYSFTTARGPIIIDPNEVDIDINTPNDDPRSNRNAPHPPVIYPNPSDGVFYIDFQQKVSSLTAEVYNMQGQMIDRYQFGKESKRFKIDMNDLSVGFYYLYLKSPTQLLKEKIQIVR